MVLAELEPPTLTIEFDEWVILPENQHRHFELFSGEIVEKMVSSPNSSRVGAILLSHLGIHVYTKNLGQITGADGGYYVGADRYIPDGAFISHEKWQAPVVAGYRTVAPDLAIEAVSPSDNPSEVTTNVTNYLLAGTVVWLADEKAKTLTVYVPNEKPQTYQKNQTLDGGKLLEGFTLDLTLVFGA